MTDNFEHALEKENRRLNGEVSGLQLALDYWKKSTENEEGRVAELRAEVERLTRERDEARREWKICQDGMESAQAERDEWKARAEAAEADNAALVETLNLVENDLSDDRYDDAHRRTIVLLKKEHPGAALLEERNNWKRMHEANVEAGSRVAAAFDKAGVGRSSDGALTRALALLERIRDLEYTVKEMELDANALWEASARLERLRAAEKVVEAARMLGAYEDFTIALEPGCDTTPDDPQELNAARHSVHAALAAYDALKEKP